MLPAPQQSTTQNVHTAHFFITDQYLKLQMFYDFKSSEHCNNSNVTVVVKAQNISMICWVFIVWIFSYGKVLDEEISL